MRTYLGIEGTKRHCNIDCITMTNKTTGEVLNLSFTETDCGLTDDGITIRQKDEETATFGLPESLEGKYGNNEQTYNFIKNSEVNSIVVVPFDDDNEAKLENLKLKSLEICIGEYNIDYNAEQLSEIILENEYNEKIG